MAITRITKNPEHWVGLTGDVHRTVGVNAGDTFTAIDTGAKYIWVEGGWQIDLTMIYAVMQAIQQS